MSREIWSVTVSFNQNQARGLKWLQIEHVFIACSKYAKHMTHHTQLHTWWAIVSNIRFNLPSSVLCRLRQRMNYLIERSSKTSPEDWRRLQQEREGLARQLSGEKEAHQKTVEENRGLRQEKSRLEEQVRNYFTILYSTRTIFCTLNYQLLGSHTWLLLLQCYFFNSNAFMK